MKVGHKHDGDDGQCWTRYADTPALDLGDERGKEGTQQ